MYKSNYIPEPTLVGSDTIIEEALRENVTQVSSGRKSISEARRDLRSFLSSVHYDPKEERGTINDLFTQERLDLMINTNVRLIRSYEQHVCATTRGAILAFPAYEFIQTYECNEQVNWCERWKACAKAIKWDGVLMGDRMIALKTSPIWARLSRFGLPYPPFDFNSGWGVEDVSKSECRKLFLI